MIPFIGIAYFLYTKALKKGVVLSKKQAVLAVRRKQLEARRKQLRVERQNLAKAQNRKTPQEQAEEEALRVKMRKDLEEQRRYKHDLMAKKMKLNK